MRAINHAHNLSRCTDYSGAAEPGDVHRTDEALDAVIIAGRIHHNGHPILRWAIGNVVAKKDAKDNVYPRKAREDNKIDPAVALIANLSLQLRFQEEEPSPWADARTAMM
jgi:phage terminase large subunit-like protein